MDLRALNRLLGEGGTVSGAWLSVDPRLSARFNARLRELPVIAGATRRTVALRSFDETLGQTLGVFRAVYLAFASLIVFSVIYNNARIAFAERGWEMASLRVLGFSRREISFILLSELAVVALAAIPPGCAIGAGLAGLITLAYESDLFRIPLVIARATYAYSALAVLLAAALSALAVRRRVDRLDLIAVLKTRE
jgi:putative ABC transport system permease protein